MYDNPLASAFVSCRILKLNERWRPIIVTRGRTQAVFQRYIIRLMKSSGSESFDWETAGARRARRNAALRAAVVSCQRKRERTKVLFVPRLELSRRVRVALAAQVL